MVPGNGQSQEPKEKSFLLKSGMKNQRSKMDKYLKAIIAMGIGNLVTGSLILGISMGWIVYYLESTKDEKRV